MKNIVYRSPNDITKFDYDRYVKSLRAYGDIDEEKLKAGLQELDRYEPLHVSCLVELGVKLIPDENKAREYYETHREWVGGFERLRRITGYLVGTVARWNDFKKAELKDRVSHSIPQGYSQEDKAIREELKQQNTLNAQV